MSAHELLDIVNAQDDVIGQATRAEIHKAGHLHRAAHIVVFDPHDRILVQKRSLSKDSNPGLWDSSAAGHVDAGESYLNCAIRELEEELGLQVSEAELRSVCRFEPAVHNGWEFQQVYLCRLARMQTLQIQFEEIDEVRWLVRDELVYWLDDSPGDFTTDFHRIWQNVAG